MFLQKQIFLAPHRRLEEKEERQLNMERAFEDMYMAATGNSAFEILTSVLPYLALGCNRDAHFLSCT